MENKVLPPVPITLQTIEQFGNCLLKKNRSEATVNKYKTDLRTFYNFLPEEKILDDTSLPQWRDYLIEANLSSRTINTRIAACNNFLCYLRRKRWRIKPVTANRETDHPPVNRNEYLSLLKAARETNNERLYFMIKTFCCLGLSISEFPCLTIDAIVRGRMTVLTKRRVREVFIPDVLQQEYLEYAKRSDINSGALFKSEIGAPLTRTIIINELANLCEIAGVPKEKGTPKMLQDLWSNTYSHIRTQTPLLIENAYADMIAQEQKTIGW